MKRKTKIRKIRFELSLLSTFFFLPIKSTLIPGIWPGDFGPGQIAEGEDWAFLIISDGVADAYKFVSVSDFLFVFLVFWVCSICSTRTTNKSWFKATFYVDDVRV